VFLGECALIPATLVSDITVHQSAGKRMTDQELLNEIAQQTSLMSLAATHGLDRDNEDVKRI
jgi:hypothetical protein